MFKDKVKVTVVALVMVLLMVLSITTDLFVGLADVFRAKAEEATPTDATPVTRDVTVYKELNDSDKDRNLAGAVIKVFKDSACTQSITEFVLSYDGKSYGGDDRVVYKSLEERANANASKAIAKLQEDTYYYQLDKKLFRSNDDYSNTGYDYNNTAGSFSIVAGDGVQEIKLDNNMFRPTEKVATPTDASSEVSSEVTTEVTTEPSTQVATTSDASSEETETTTQVATSTDSISEVKPVATLASVFRMAKAAKAATTTAVSRGTGYGYGGETISYIFYINKGLTYNNTGYAFCMEEGKTGPTSGTGTVSSIGKGNITKALYYSFAGPGAGSYDGAPSSGGLNGDNVMTLSCILDYYYTGYWDSGDFGAAYDDAILYEKWLKGKDMPNTLADTAFSIAGKSDDFTASRAAYNITDKTQTTNEWAVVSKKSVTVTIPTGVTMHKTDSNGKKSTHGAGTATVSNGDKIYFSASVAKGGTSTVKFTSVKGYSAYKADFGAELQVLGFLGKPTDKEFTAKLQWNSPNFSLRKTDSKTKQPVEGAEYLVYCAQDNEKVNVVRFKTNSNGVGEITSVNPTQASGEVGKTVVKLKAGVRYYIVETKAPEHYKLNKNKQIAIGGEKYPYEAHIGVNATDGHVDYTSITGATFSTTATGVTYHTVDKVAHDPINIVIDKVDSIREDGTQVGKTSLAGAIFKMEYYQGKTTASGTPTNTWYIKTVKNVAGDYEAKFAKGFIVNEGTYKSDAAPNVVDASGVYELEDGAMRITEVKAPSGYKVVDGKNKGFFKVKRTKVTGSSITVQVMGGRTIYAGVEITADAFKQYEQKERYDFKLKKVDSYGNPMAGVAFLVTASNGDQHVVVTDKNGEFDSSKLGYTDVNGNDATLAKAMADTTLYPTYKETNVFFTTPGSGKTAAAEIKEETVDGKAPRPLYKDTYTIREIHRQYVTIDGKKYKMTQVYDIGPAQTITVPDSAKDGAVINFGTYTNTAIPKMTSSAISTDTNTKMSVAGKNSSFKDSIKATNLKASTKYTLMSVAVDANTGKAYKDADGKYVAKNVAVTTGAVKTGTVFPETTASVTFTGVNTSNVKSRKLVFYEYLVEGSVTKTVSLDSAGKPVEPANCVAKDASVSNKAQTVNVISLETKVLVNSTKTNESPAAISTVTDTVTTHGLIAGESFTINSTIKIDGKSIGVQSTDFTAEGNDKEVSVVFKDLDLSKFANKRLSIVTELIYKNKVILTHNDDGKDLNEEFYTPEMHSNAIDVDTLTKMSKTSKTAKFKDTVDIKNLSTATQYTLQSIAVDTATGLAYKDANEKYVVGHEVFTTESAEDNQGADRVGATVDIEFTANTKGTNVTQITFYEYLVRGSVDSDISVDENGYPVRPANWIAEDASTSNTDQTLNLVNLETKVLVDSTKTNVAPADKKVDVTDTVTLHNLVAGTKFTLVGKVSDGENIKVENEVEFTAKGGDETVSVPFKSLDLTKYAGKSLYVICELKYDGEVIATHNEDGTDPDEVFYVPAVETNAIDATTNTQYSILDKTQIIDSVKYSNLPTEYEYELETTFVDSATGEEIKKTEIEKDPYWSMLKDLGYVTDETSSDSTGDSVAEDTGKIVSEIGKAFKRTQILKPEKMDDTVDVAFDIDPRSFNLEGKTITIQQVIKLNGVVVAKHTDKDAESQQISFPTGSTLAVDNTSHNHTIAPTKNADVVDTIFCKNLVTGISVDFYGIAIDKDTNKPVELNGKPVVVKQNETISKADQEVQLHYIVDGTKLKGKRLTSFVFAVYNGKIVFKHTDLNSAEQSFSFSSLRTKFLDDKNGTHATMLTEDVHQTDTVTLDGLTKGEGFTLKGVVYNKSTRKPMLVNGKQVTNSIDFTAKGNSEEVALKYQYNGLKSDAYHKDKNDDLVSFVYLYKDGILIDKEEDFDSFDQTIKLPSCGTSASDGITKLHVGYASKTAIFRDSVDYYNLIVGDWYSTTLTLHLNKDGKDAGPLKDANGNLITATVKFQAKTTDGSVKVEVKYDASLLAGETITAFETIRTKGYEVCGHTEITDEGQQIHYPELKTSAKNSKDNSQHVKEGEVAKIVDTVNYSKLDSSVAYKVVTEAWDYNTQQIVVSDGKKVRKVTELHVDSKKPENGSFDVSMSFKTDGLGKHRIVIFEYVYDNKGNLISKEADFDAESQTIYIDKTPNKTGDRTVMFLSILAGMLGLGVVTLFVTKRKKK